MSRHLLDYLKRQFAGDRLIASIPAMDDYDLRQLDLRLQEAEQETQRLRLAIAQEQAKRQAAKQQ